MVSENTAKFCLISIKQKAIKCSNGMIFFLTCKYLSTTKKTVLKSWCWKLLSLLIKISGLPRNHGDSAGSSKSSSHELHAKSFILAEDLAQHVSFLVIKLMIVMLIWWKLQIAPKSCKKSTKSCSPWKHLPVFPSQQNRGWWGRCMAAYLVGAHWPGRLSATSRGCPGSSPPWWMSQGRDRPRPPSGLCWWTCAHRSKQHGCLSQPPCQTSARTWKCQHTSPGRGDCHIYNH